jgi:hypothetical protein
MTGALKTTGEIVEAIRRALEGRRYDEFVDLFADDGTYEVPFALPPGPQRYAGVAQIRARFDAVAISPVGRLLKIQTLSATVHAGDDPAVTVVEFTAQGTLQETGAAFSVVSSIAVIRCAAGKVVQYRDYPNTLGIAAAAGVLQQFAASLK